MDQHDHRALTKALLSAVLTAGKLEMGYFNSGLPVHFKADQSPVTIADQQAEAIILKALADVCPGLPVVAEEAHAAGARPTLSETFLLVDALDGTKQFVSGQPNFTINIAIIHSGRPIYGLIYAPAHSDLLVTDGQCRPLRARISPDDQPASFDRLAFSPVCVRPVPATGIVALQSRSRNLEVSNRFLEDYPVGGTQRLGSSYKFCLIACGEAEIYPQLGDTCEWDTAAGEAILLAAGGSVVSIQGDRLVYGKSERNYLNPYFVASSAPLTLLKKTRPILK
jgi:3'(2'), 5'-bisphosphate nucleotidase